MKDTTSGDTPPDVRTGSEAIQVESEEDPFAEYLWMEHEEEFNQQVEEQLWEEEFIEQCFQELLEEEQQWEEELIESCNQEEAEQWVWFVPPRAVQPQTLHQPRGQISLLVLDAELDLVINSRLNPNAKEFIPGIQKHIM